MFTGIIQSTGRIREILATGSNKTFWIESPISPNFKPDQSVSHSGACLTVEEVLGSQHRVTAIAETLDKTNLGDWTLDTHVNLETSLTVNSLVDGHLVQGHVDTIATCTQRKEIDGSWEFEFSFPSTFAALIIEKGSIAVNGISLTVYNVKKKRFRVAIIPYTFQHTNIHYINPGDSVNLEFDMLGKYLFRYLTLHSGKK